jgi:hypothetical protein
MLRKVSAKMEIVYVLTPCTPFVSEMSASYYQACIIFKGLFWIAKHATCVEIQDPTSTVDLAVHYMPK